jgi:hypothetical protein
MDWKPIESAPRDGRHVLLYRLMWGGNIQQVCFWRDNGWYIWDYGRLDAIDDLGGITHWMDLPEPPTSAKGIGF